MSNLFDAIKRFAGNAEDNAANKIAGWMGHAPAPPPPVDKTTDPNYRQFQPLPTLPQMQYMQMARKWEPGQPAPTLQPYSQYPASPQGLGVTPGYGGQQSNYAEDDLTPVQALQPVDYNNGQVSLNTAFMQGSNPLYRRIAEAARSRL